jgi:hypothetical protein
MAYPCEASPQMMLMIYFIGGLVINILPGIISVGEFGHRGFMFGPYRIKPGWD